MSSCSEAKLRSYMYFSSTTSIQALRIKFYNTKKHIHNINDVYWQTKGPNNNSSSSK